MTEKNTPNFEYYAPDTVDGVLALLDKYGEEAKVISGGTDFIPKMKALVWNPGYVIGLKQIKKLAYIDYDCKTGLHIGAETTLRTVENHPLIRKLYPALYEGIHSMASTQIRNAGTIAGNICNAVPSADTAPPLLVLDASLKIVNSKGERIVPIDEFFTGVCRTILEPNEIITEIILPKVSDGTVMKYYKSSVRKALDLAIVGVATNIKIVDGICKEAKIALGAVAITPKRAYETEKMLIGKPFTEKLIEEAALYASTQECSPISDIRASKEYRRELVRLSVRDGLREALG